MSNKIKLIMLPKFRDKLFKHLQRRRKSRGFGIEVGPRGIGNIKARRRRSIGCNFVAIARAQ